MRTVRKRRSSALITTVALIASGCAVLAVAACDSPYTPRTIEVTVPSGATFDSVLDTLVIRGVVVAKRRFRFYARLTGADRRIRAGSYGLVPGAPWSEILDSLTSGRVMTFGMTIPEGFTIADMAIFPWCRLHGRQGQGLDDFPNVKRWFEAVAARPAVAKDMARLEDKADRTKWDAQSWPNLFGAEQYRRR